MCAPMLSLRGNVEACDSAAQDTSASSYYYVVHTSSGDKLSSGASRISCSPCAPQVTQCTPTSSHALLTCCQPTETYDTPQSTKTFSPVTD